MTMKPGELPPEALLDRVQAVEPKHAEGEYELDFDLLLAVATEPFPYAWQGSTRETYEPQVLRSWIHLTVILAHLGRPGHGLEFLIFSETVGHRAAQVLGTPEKMVVELLPPDRVLRVTGSGRAACHVANSKGIGEDALAGEHLDAKQALSVIRPYLETGLITAPWSTREYRY